MNFDDLATRAGWAARAVARGAERPSIAAVRRAKRRTVGIGALGAGFVVTVVVLGAIALWPDPVPRPPAAVSSTSVPHTAFPSTSVQQAVVSPSTSVPQVATPTTTTTLVTAMPPPAAWSIAYPATWQRADSELMPNLSWDSVTLATFPLVPGGDNCAHLPENSLRALGSRDALISIFLSRTVGSDARPWPADGFDAAVFPQAGGPVDAHECAQRPELTVHWGPWLHGSEGMYVLVAFGDETPEAVRNQAWKILSSLIVPETRDPAAPCIATRPLQPGLTVPPSHPDTPVFGVWYGTDELWTVLQADAGYLPRKSVWWSRRFPGGVEEEQPEITVTWERLDADETIIAGPPGTNAFTSEEGWFMIAGIDPQTAGCWRVTARYKGAQLSYVYDRTG